MKLSKAPFVTIALSSALAIVGCQETHENRPAISGTAHGFLPKSPVGSTFRNIYVNSDGLDVYETYRVQPDHSIKLINRDVVAGGT